MLNNWKPYHTFVRKRLLKIYYFHWKCWLAVYFICTFLLYIYMYIPWYIYLYFGNVLKKVPLLAVYSFCSWRPYKRLFTFFIFNWTLFCKCFVKNSPDFERFRPFKVLGEFPLSTHDVWKSMYDLLRFCAFTV